MRGVRYPGLTKVNSIWFLLFEIKRVLVNNSTIQKLTDFFIPYTFSFQMYMSSKKCLGKKAIKNMFNGSNWVKKSQISGILTKPLNPRDVFTYNSCTINVLHKYYVYLACTVPAKSEPGPVCVHLYFVPLLRPVPHHIQPNHLLLDE